MGKLLHAKREWPEGTDVAEYAQRHFGFCLLDSSEEWVNPELGSGASVDGVAATPDRDDATRERGCTRCSSNSAWQQLGAALQLSGRYLTPSAVLQSAMSLDDVASGVPAIPLALARGLSRLDDAASSGAARDPAACEQCQRAASLPQPSVPQPSPALSRLPTSSAPIAIAQRLPVPTSPPVDAAAAAAATSRWLSAHWLPPLEFSPERVAAEAGMDGTGLAAFIQENAPLYFTHVESLAGTLECLSDAALLAERRSGGSRWQVISAARKHCACPPVADFAVLPSQLNMLPEQCVMAITARSVARHNLVPAPRSFRPVVAPVMYRAERCAPFVVLCSGRSVLMHL